MNKQNFKKLILWVMLFGIFTGTASAQSTEKVEISDTPVEFPKDHFFHDNINEWVYFSGFVKTTKGKELGVVCTIFQNKYGDNLVNTYMLGVVDPETATFNGGPRLRCEGNVEGNENGLPHIKMTNYEFNWEDDTKLFLSSSIKTDEGKELDIQLNMKPSKDILYHGEDAYIKMGDSITSGYYSLTNLLPTDGKISIGDEEHIVEGGRMWMDRQWGDWGMLGYKWDWFSFRFDDGGSLMLFQFRDRNEQPTFGNWTYRDKDGKVQYGKDFKVTAKRKSGRFPIDWVVELPSIEAKFDVKPLFDDQAFIPMLWEGFCTVEGTIGKKKMKGQVVVELCLY